LRAKNPPKPAQQPQPNLQKPHNNQHQQQQKQNPIQQNPKQQQQQQQQPQQQQQQATPLANKQKLISKTQFLYQNTNQSPPVAAPNQIMPASPNNPIKPLHTILSRNQQQQSSNQSPQKSSNNTLLASLNSNNTSNANNPKKYVQSLTNNSINSKSASSVVPSVPLGTGELAPNASVLPIPFGLNTNKPPSQQPTPTRNALLAQLCGKDHMSILAQSAPMVGMIDDNFVRLSRINKLREILRNETPNFDETNNIISYFEQKCETNNISHKYIQYEYDAKDDAKDTTYYGELILDSFRLASDSNKKRKKCKINVFKSALEILKSKSELAVKAVVGPKRDSSLIVSDGNKPSADFEYELYRTDSNQSEPVVHTMPKMNIPVVPEIGNMISLNDLLKSMQLPKEVGVACHNATANESNVEQEVDNDDNDEDDEENNKHQMSDKKLK
jgi:hypothetical protein